MAKLRTWVRPIVLVGTGWGAAYFGDPVHGRGRRTQLRDQALARVRRLRRRATRKAEYLEHRMEGVKAELHGAGRPHPADDRAVAEEIRRRIKACPFPTSDVTIEFVEGVATLRGQLQHPEEVRTVRKAAQGAPGVNRVVSYLHLPGALPPNKAEAIKASHEHAPADAVVKH
jgi:hypothetical protein